jgi:hypothetical protein
MPRNELHSAIPLGILSFCAQRELSPAIAANGATLASIMSVLVNLPVVLRVGRQRRLTVCLAWALGVVTLLALSGVVVEQALFPLKLN